MLSYRHAFHAGNNADVLKHAVLCILLRHFTQKEAPFMYVDTHSGAGLYRLDSEWAQKTLEAQRGIVRLLEVAGQSPSRVPESVRSYLETAASYFAGFQYPGSPELARVFCRQQDSLILSELHTNEVELLRVNMRGDPRIHIHCRNGFEMLSSLSLPARSCVLIDPSYETASDFTSAASAVQKAYRRNRAVSFALWYPLVARRQAETARLLQVLCSMFDNDEKIMQAELFFPFSKAENAASIQIVPVQSENVSDYGLYGSGMLVLNAPWKCREQTEEVLSYISAALSMEYRMSANTSE